MQDRHTDTGQQPGRAQHGATHPISHAAPHPLPVPRNKGHKQCFVLQPRSWGRQVPQSSTGKLSHTWIFFSPPLPQDSTHKHEAGCARACIMH